MTNKGSKFLQGELDKAIQKVNDRNSLIIKLNESYKELDNIKKAKELKLDSLYNTNLIKSIFRLIKLRKEHKNK